MNLKLRSAIGTVVAVLTFLALPAALAWNSSAFVPTEHLDGAFQTASALQHLASGDFAGRDFLPYLGIGPSLVLLPTYEALGGTICASVFSAAFVTLIALEAAASIVALVLLGRRAWRLALWLAPVPVMLYMLLRHAPWLIDVGDVGDGLGALDQLAVPGNSLRGLRAFAPYLLMLAAAAVVGRGRGSRVQVGVLGVAAGTIAATWSNDFGPVSGSLLLFFVTLWGLRKPRWKITSLIALWLVAGIAWLLAGLVVTAGHLEKYLHYNWIDVRNDQYWYFTPWWTKVNSAADLTGVMKSEHVWTALIILLVMSALAVTKRDSRLGVGAFGGWASFSGGTVATVAGHPGNYYLPFKLWSLLVIVVGAIAGIDWWVKRASVRSQPRNAPALLSRLLPAVVVGVVAATALPIYATARDERTALSTNPAYVWEANLGGYLPVDFVPHLEQTMAFKGTTVEEYVGLYTMVAGNGSPNPVDSVISALGSERTDFERRLAEDPPGQVITTAPAHSVWSTWSISANWWFYRPLFQSYVPRQTSPNTLVWTRTATAQWPSVGCEVDNNARTISLDSRAPGFYEVTLHYSGPGVGSRSLSLVQNNIQVVDVFHYLPLDPGATAQAFPVYVASPAPVRLDVRDELGGGRGVATTLTSCTGRQIVTPEGSQVFDLFQPGLFAGLY